MPGAYWYAAMSWVYGEGGQIADQGLGRQVDRHARRTPRRSPVCRSGPTCSKKYCKGDPTKDENDQDAIFAQGHAASSTATAGRSARCSRSSKDPNDPNSPMVDTAVKGKVASVPLPGATAGKGLPTFLGGSAIGVSGKSQNKALAAGVGQVLHRHHVAEGPDRQGRAAQRDRRCSTRPPR